VRAVDIAKVTATMTAARDEFANARPFPHVVIENFLDPDVAAALAAEFDGADDGWTFYHHVNEKKRGLADVTRMGPTSRAVIAELSSPPFIAALERLTGIDDLLADPDLDGGGLHETRPGGYLNVHTDFLAHTLRRTWSRQLNLLLFLNADWEESYRGWLEFWDARVQHCERRIAPLFNRCVVFRTSAQSFHGVPAGVACPEDRSRRSLALYYFRDEARVLSLNPTRYVPLPGDSLGRRALIRADRFALRLYAVLKRYTPLGDRVVSRILKHL
jgi:Rps23 Pro-64 3,4-dihydroxylase Tpa1-like proline 4-hydroxylase